MRYMRAYRETIDWMYSDPAALKTYAEFAGITEAKAKRIRDDYFPKVGAVNPDEIVGLDLIMPEAVNLKFISAPLTKEQLAELIQIPPRTEFVSRQDSRPCGLITPRSGRGSRHARDDAAEQRQFVAADAVLAPRR